jgi:cytolysin (calcineurin-like family phosphatase)
MNNSVILIKDATGITVSKPFGVFLTGDITDGGTKEQWEEFEQVFGLNGEGNLKIPVYETYGNHDGNVGGIVREGIRERNTRRVGITMTSENGVNYVIKEKGHLFIVLGSYPGNQWDPGCGWCHYFKETFRDPDGSLAFLESVLEENRKDENLPVFLFFHYGWDEFSKLWWTQEEQKNFLNVLQGTNVKAIFHGHNHALEAYKWEGIDVFISGSPQRGEKSGVFLLVSEGRRGKHVFVVSNSEVKRLK